MLCSNDCLDCYKQTARLSQATDHKRRHRTNSLPIINDSCTGIQIVWDRCIKQSVSDNLDNTTHLLILIPTLQFITCYIVGNFWEEKFSEIWKVTMVFKNNFQCCYSADILSSRIGRCLGC